MRRLALRTGLLLGLLLVGGWLYLFGYSSPPVDPDWVLEPAGPDATAGAVTVRFSGTSTLLFSDGDTEWMVDGWFTRPGPLQTLFGEVVPDPDARNEALRGPAAPSSAIRSSSAEADL